MRDFHARVPVNATASRVTRSGEQPSSRDYGDNARPAPFPTRALPSWAKSLIGIRYDGVEVIALARYEAPKKKKRTRADRLRWVVRCNCGYYALRSSKAIEAKGGGVCRRCERVRSMRWIASQPTEGAPAASPQEK